MGLLKKTFSTIVSRYLAAALNFAIIIINAKLLGAEGVGRIGIILASVNLAVMLNSMFCGSTIVYFMQQYTMRRIMFPSYLWIMFVSAISSFVMMWLGMIPSEYTIVVYILTLLNSLVAANSRFLLGKDNVKAFNIVFLLQSTFLFFILMFIYYIIGSHEVTDYINGMYISNFTALAVSAVYLYKPYREEKDINTTPYSQVFRRMFTYGIWSNADNMAESISTRLSYFFVNTWAGLSSVGLLDGATRISESVWHISRAVGYIANSEVARSETKSHSRSVTLKLLKLTFFSTFALMGVILLIPEKLFTAYIFSSQFEGITVVIRCLAPGIIAAACNTVLCQYFIAGGMIKYSAISSIFGLVAAALFGVIFVPAYGVAGGAAATSAGYCVMALSNYIFFSTKA